MEKPTKGNQPQHYTSEGTTTMTTPAFSYDLIYDTSTPTVAPRVKRGVYDDFSKAVYALRSDLIKRVYEALTLQRQRQPAWGITFQGLNAKDGGGVRDTLILAAVTSGAEGVESVEVLDALIELARIAHNEVVETEVEAKHVVVHKSERKASKPWRFKRWLECEGCGERVWLKKSERSNDFMFSHPEGIVDELSIRRGVTV